MNRSTLPRSAYSSIVAARFDRPFGSVDGLWHRAEVPIRQAAQMTLAGENPRTVKSCVPVVQHFFSLANIE